MRAPLLLDEGVSLEMSTLLNNHFVPCNYTSHFDFLDRKTRLFGFLKEVKYRVGMRSMCLWNELILGLSAICFDSRAGYGLEDD
jgi:hypothetical protein